MAIALKTNEARFRAMGTDVHVVVVEGRPELVDLARDRIEALERSWSRFRPESDVTRLNQGDGRAQRVDASTWHALRVACDAWVLTSGAFDPTVARALAGLGYDRDFAAIVDEPRPGARGREARPAPGCADIRFGDAGTVQLPAGVRVDLGGIGKGLAADIVVDQLVAAGAAGACVNIGGDLRVEGRSPSDDAWSVELDRRESSHGHRFVVVGGGIATSTVGRRRWRHDGADVHHIIDPGRGLPAASDVATAVVIASECSTAEALSSASIVLGTTRARVLIERVGVAALLIGHDGTEVRANGVEEYER